MNLRMNERILFFSFLFLWYHVEYFTNIYVCVLFQKIIILYYFFHVSSHSRDIYLHGFVRNKNLTYKVNKPNYSINIYCCSSVLSTFPFNWLENSRSYRFRMRNWNANWNENQMKIETKAKRKWNGNVERTLEQQ
jgi:hypothetical protein